MLWRLSPAEFKAGKGDGNRAALRRLAENGPPPGILAYDGEQAIGWCALAPRAEYSGLARSRVLKPVDEQPVWSVSCFYIDKAYRRRGVSVALLTAAVDFARSRGARIVEGYPVEPDGDNYPAVFAWTGTAKTYTRAGFDEVLRRSPTRPIMRRSIES